jgi:hypothetical protein
MKAGKKSSAEATVRFGACLAFRALLFFLDALIECSDADAAVLDESVVVSFTMLMIRAGSSPLGVSAGDMIDTEDDEDSLMLRPILDDMFIAL